MWKSARSIELKLSYAKRNLLHTCIVPDNYSRDALGLGLGLQVARRQKPVAWEGFFS